MTGDAPPAAASRGADQALWVGLFLIVGLVTTLGVLFTMTDAALFRGRYVVTTHVPDAIGIRRGDPVQLHGVNVGRVLGFSIAPAGVLVRLEIEGEYRIPADSKVRIESAGLLGGMLADVVPGQSSEDLRSGDTLEGSAEEPVAKATQRLADEASGAIERVDKLLSDRLIASVHGNSAQLSSLLQALSAALKEQRQELRLLESSLRRNSEGLERATKGPELERALQRLDQVSAHADSLSASLDRSSRSVEGLLGRVERGEGTLGKLSQDDALYAELTGAARSIQRAGTDLSALVSDIRKNPRKYLKFSLF